MTGSSESGTQELPQGRHTFPFSFMLPPNLPSSFEGGVGHVRYDVKATIDKPWKFDHTTKRPFTVVCILDLNADPNAQVIIQIWVSSNAHPVGYAPLKSTRIRAAPLHVTRMFLWFKS